MIGSSTPRNLYSPFVSLLLLFLLPLLVPTTLSAQDTSPASLRSDRAYLDQSLDTALQGTAGGGDGAADSLESMGSGSGLGWFFAKVVVLLGLLSGGVWLVVRVLKGSGVGGGGSELMGVRSTLPLGQNQYLQIVQVGPQFFMLGVTQNEVSMLGEIDDDETVQALNLHGNDEESSDAGSTNRFQQLIQRFTGTKDHQFNRDNQEDRLDQLRQKVAQLGEEGEPTR